MIKLAIALGYMRTITFYIDQQRNMKRLSLICSSACPKYEPVKRMLEEIGLVFKEINQDNLHKGCSGKKFSSPTLLIDDDVVIFGGETDSLEGACSTNLPNKQELETLIKALV